jgi:hypothetical protein
MHPPEINPMNPRHEAGCRTIEAFADQWSAIPLKI